MSKRVRVAAVAEIGSGGIDLKIGQTRKEGLRIIDALSYPLPIGRDTFVSGKIRFGLVDKACSILKNYAVSAKEYGAETFRVVAASAVREAGNREYILDQIRVKTGLNVEALDSQEEKSLIYKLMCRLTPPEYLESALMVHIGSGNLGVSVLENGIMTRFQNIRLGSLRLSELFEDRQDTTRAFRGLVEEYLASFTDYLDADMPQEIRHFIAAGSDLEFLPGLLGGAKSRGLATSSRSALDGLYCDVKSKSVPRIAEHYQVSKEEAEILPPALSIFNDLLSFTSADRIYMPEADLSGAALWELLAPEEFAPLNEMFRESAAASARVIAARYNCDMPHHERVAEAALIIFDRMKKAHGLGAHERLLLHIAALTHDIGKFVSLRHHYKHSYSIIRELEIVGMSAEDMEIAANIALYHSSRAPKTDDAGLRAMRTRNRAITAKLAAIIRLADALDRSHKQKYTAIDVSLSADRLTVAAAARRDMSLEQWSFETKSDYFKEVFGLEAELKWKLDAER